MSDFYSSDEIRSIIHNAHKIKEFNKCHECNGTGFLNWDGEVGDDVKPGRLAEYDDIRIDGECQKCDGIGYLDITKKVFMENTRIDAYLHTRNKNCIYRRIGDTNVFQWDKYKRSEEGILRDMLYDYKFKPFNEKNIKL